MRRLRRATAGRKEEFAADSREFHFYGEWLHYEAFYLGEISSPWNGWEITGDSPVFTWHAWFREAIVGNIDVFVFSPEEEREKILAGETLRKQLQNGDSSAVLHQSDRTFTHKYRRWTAASLRFSPACLDLDGNNETLARYFIRNRPFIRAGRKVWSLTDSQALILNPTGRRAKPRSFTSCEPLSQRKNVLPREDSYLVFVGTRRSLTSWCTFGSICTHGTYNFLIVSIWGCWHVQISLFYFPLRVLYDQATREHSLIDPRFIVLKCLDKLHDENSEEKIEDRDIAPVLSGFCRCHYVEFMIIKFKVNI